MRVLFVALEWPAPDHHSGGVGRYAFRLASALRHLVELTVLTVEGGMPLDGVQFLYVKRPRSRFSRYYWLPFHIRRVANAIDVDVVHAHGDDWAMRKGASAHVRTFYGSSLREARSSSGLRKFNHYALWVLEKLSQRRADLRLTISPDGLTEFKCKYLVPPVAETVFFSRAPSDTPTFVFVGSFEGRKRGYLVQSAVREAANVTGRNIALKVVGPAADKTQWDGWVHHYSGLSDEEVRRLLSEAWGLLAPSEYEGFGIPAFEALSAQTAVIGTANPGLDYLQDIVGHDAGAITISAPEDLGQEVARRVTLGPTSQIDAEAARGAVRQLLNASSPAYLVGTIYPDAALLASKRRRT